MQGLDVMMQLSVSSNASIFLIEYKKKKSRSKYPRYNKIKLGRSSVAVNPGASGMFSTVLYL